MSGVRSQPSSAAEKGSERYSLTNKTLIKTQITVSSAAGADRPCQTNISSAVTWV